jgi:(E)-4-hydroxy-3-methylbut-2-enyl-diphosphate synthase
MFRDYCPSRVQSRRRFSRTIQIGDLKIGGSEPIAIQSMTNTPTQDVEATVRQCIELAEAGCDLVRVTAQNVSAAKALKAIRAQFSNAGFSKVPLVADIHFLPSAAMEAIEHVEKVRINPGNFADKKKFDAREYTDADYQIEIERLYDAFSPLVLRAKSLGRALRIGTNHGSLSDRIMNRYGDSPLGMVESAMEFLRIAENHAYHDIVISMKSSNPKVAIQAYRLMVHKMGIENMHYPLHLGVTEAGDGDDARIKSAVGIGSLLLDGLGDTIRVSLTEDPVAEVPVARQIARKAWKQWTEANDHPAIDFQDTIDPFTYERRSAHLYSLGLGTDAAGMETPRVFLQNDLFSQEAQNCRSEIERLKRRYPTCPIEGLIYSFKHLTEGTLQASIDALDGLVPAIILDLKNEGPGHLRQLQYPTQSRFHLIYRLEANQEARAKQLLTYARLKQIGLILDIDPIHLGTYARLIRTLKPDALMFTCSKPIPHYHGVGTYRQLAETLKSLLLPYPIWIRNTQANALDLQPQFADQLTEAALMSGSLICDGIGDVVSVETVPHLQQTLMLSYNILQGTRARTVKTEYIACPSCGRTLFDLQSTTHKIREATGHLKGVTIAIMGCIVNGPGEMADADFGYVGGAPGKINLYVGKTPVQFNIPSTEAVERLIDLIKTSGKWTDPEPLMD